MKLVVVLAVMAVCPAAVAWAQMGEKPSLTVCMQQNDPPLSQRAGDRPSGFDLALSDIVAQRLARELRVQWFVSRDDPDASLATDSNALLSDGHCQLVAEYPLTRSTVEPPRSPSAKLPPFEGARPDDRRRWVKTAELAATRPYRLDALTVVLSAEKANRSVTALRDLDGMKVGVQIATLADAIAMQYDGGRLSQHVVHVPETRDLFDKVQKGELDAAFVDLHAFDAWRLRHGSNGVMPSSYRHTVGFNMGFVGLASDRQLIEAVDQVLADLLANDGLAPIAASAGLTFVPPRTPAVLPDVTLTALNGD